MLKQFFFFRRIRIKYFSNGKPVKPATLLSDFFLKSVYDLRYPEMLQKYLEMQYAKIGGELHVHEDRVRSFDRFGNEIIF